MVALVFTKVFGSAPLSPGSLIQELLGKCRKTDLPGAALEDSRAETLLDFAVMI